MRHSHIEQAHRQVEQALQTADQQIEALQARVTKKNAQLSETKLRLEHLRDNWQCQGGQDGAESQRHRTSSLLDTESSEQTGRLPELLCTTKTKVAPQDCGDYLQSSACNSEL